MKKAILCLSIVSAALGAAMGVSQADLIGVPRGPGGPGTPTCQDLHDANQAGYCLDQQGTLLCYRSSDNTYQCKPA
ncbi:hypothetical protein [Paramesorhizobium deserti]|uniref:hypothetical protein n=1 Tax=Paramesorhizobium deserti TaxID=1494590 RepID=UPI0012902325|nr:hypothetical protein [Paramesorhizobium deserti]